MNNKRKVLNNNGIGILLLINIVLLMINIVSTMSMNKVDGEVVYASGNDESEQMQASEKRKNDDNENNDEEVFGITFKLETVAEHSQGSKGTPMYYSHSDNYGAYFTYAPTEKPKDWKDGYWYVSHDVMAQGDYDIKQLNHNSELKAIYIADEKNGGYDHMQLKPNQDSVYSYQ